MAELWRDADHEPKRAPPFMGGGELTLEEIAALRPAAALVAEPTELNVVVAHRGVARWQCTVHGRAAHSSRPEEGANAVYAMARVVQLIEQFHRETLAHGLPIRSADRRPRASRRSTAARGRTRFPISR